MIISPKTKALIAGVALLLVAGGVAASVIVTRSVEGPLALKQAFEKTASASPFSVSATIQSRNTEDASDMFSATFEAVGVGSTTPSKGTVSLSGLMPEDAGSISASVEWRRLTPNTYIKLAPGITLPDFPFDTAMFTDRWIVLADDEEGSTTDLMSGISPIALPQCESAELQRVMKSIDPSAFLTISSTSRTEITLAPSEGATIYALTVDSLALEKDLQAALAEAGCASTEIPQNFSDISDVTIAVGEQTGYIRAVSGTTIEDGTTVQFAATLGGFGEAVTVDAPTGAVTFEELINEAFSSMFGEAEDMPLDFAP